MADGSHLGFIKKPETFEQFEITKPNLVSRLSTHPEFSQILKFLAFWKSKMADGSHLGFIQKPATFELFEITTLVFQLFELNTRVKIIKLHKFNNVRKYFSVFSKKNPTYLPYFF